MTPIDELRAAATKLREIASAAAPGAPWVLAEQMEDCGLGDAASAWIALASPALAEPLAEWLEMTADWWDAFGIDPETDHPALAVARAINGRQP